LRREGEAALSLARGVHLSNRGNVARTALFDVLSSNKTAVALAAAVAVAALVAASSRAATTRARRRSVADSRARRRAVGSGIAPPGAGAMAGSGISATAR
jgi:hypothetical protein